MQSHGGKGRFRGHRTSLVQVQSMWGPLGQGENVMVSKDLGLVLQCRILSEMRIPISGLTVLASWHSSDRQAHGRGLEKPRSSPDYILFTLKRFR